MSKFRLNDVSKPSTGEYQISDFPNIRRRWVTMMHGCYNPEYRDYAIYGAKGILVSETWKCWDNFCEWFIGEAIDIAEDPLTTKRRINFSVNSVKGHECFSPASCILK